MYVHWMGRVRRESTSMYALDLDRLGSRLSLTLAPVEVSCVNRKRGRVGGGWRMGSRNDRVVYLIRNSLQRSTGGPHLSHNLDPQLETCIAKISYHG